MGKTKNKVGRPTVMTESVLSKLREGFLYGFTDEQACARADISPKSLYRYIEDNPEFGQKKEARKEFTTLRAKKNVADKVEKGDIQQSNRRLERKAKNEFSTKQELDAKVEGKLEGIKITLDE